MAFNFDVSINSRGVDYRGFDRLVNDPRGEVGQHLNRIGRQIVIGAKAQVGTDTNQLRDSIHLVHNRDTAGQYIKVVADNEIAYIHHEGTRPHPIAARGQNHLRFSNSGRMVYTRVVMHPGTRPNRYLSDQLPRFVR